MHLLSCIMNISYKISYKLTITQAQTNTNAMSQRTRRNKVAQIEARRSGFDLERRRSGMSERSFCQNDREQYGTCVDAAQRKGLRLTSFACMHSTDQKPIAWGSCFWGVVDRTLRVLIPSWTKNNGLHQKMKSVIWRRERDSNPWTLLTRYTISNRAPSTNSAISAGLMLNKQK